MKYTIGKGEQYSDYLQDQHECLKAFLPLVVATRWDAIWQEVHQAFPVLDITLPQLDHMEEPCGHIVALIDLARNGRNYSVHRFHYTQEPPTQQKQLMFWLGMGTWESIKHISYEEIPAALARLGLPTDGWSTVYGRLTHDNGIAAG